MATATKDKKSAPKRQSTPKDEDQAQDVVRNQADKRKKQEQERKAAEKEVKGNSGDSRKLFERQHPAVNIDSTTLPYLPEGSPDIPGFAEVVSGEHEGRYGVVEQVTATDDNGFPKTVTFRTRDDDTVLLTVEYKDLKKSWAGRR